MADERKFRKLIIFGGLILLLSGASLATANVLFSLSEVVCEGVMAGNVALGGLDRNAAAQKIKDAAMQDKTNDAIRLVGEKGTWTIGKDEIGLQLDVEALAEAAYKVGRSENPVNSFKERYLAANQNFKLPLNTIYDQKKLKMKIEAIAKEIDRLPKNAELRYAADGSLQIIKEENGFRLDVAALEKQIMTELGKNFAPLTIKLSTETVEAKITEDGFKGIEARLSRYATQYDATDYNRQKNISIAAEKLSGVLLKPGEVFSFNQTVGRRTQENGYLDAPVYADGKLTVDIGGGVCQVSTTLYNAALLADLKIEERSSHFRPPGYVPLGYDAAVADGLLDLKFANDTGAPVYIAVKAFGGILSVDIYGRQPPDGQEIKIMVDDKRVLEPTVVIRQDEKLDFGKEIIENEGSKGYQVSLSRVVLQDGKTVKRESLSNDEFTPEAKVVRVGTRLLKGKK